MLGLVLLLTGCAVGPNFTPPAAPNTDSYIAGDAITTTGSAAIKGGEEQTLVRGRDIPTEWWELFQSPQLDELVTKALVNNPDLQAADAALKQARYNYRASRGNLLPDIDAGFNASRNKLSNKSFGFGSNQGGETIYNLYNASIDVSYDIDLWGAIRRENESQEAVVDYQNYQREAAGLTIAANVVTTAIQEASLRGQINAAEDIIAAERRQLDLLNRQFEAGAIAKTDVLLQAANLAQSEATLPPLRKQLSQTRHLLSVLIGQLPSDALSQEFTLDKLTLPNELPLTLPSQLVAQRPDIKAAEAVLHQASAQIGIAMANMLPRISLSASYGSGAGQIDELFTPGSALWSLGSGILQPVFRGGELLNRKRASEAAYDQAAAQYRSTVLNAFREVADALRALQLDTDALRASLAAEQAAKTSLDLARSQFQAGAISAINVLNAEQIYEQSRLALVQAQAQRYANTAALFQALGGGWWNRSADASEKSTIQASQAE